MNTGTPIPALGAEFSAPYGCRRCDARWGGLKTSHCTACHHTFTTASAFDRHRSGLHVDDTRFCLYPVKAGLVNAGRAYPCWGFPGRDDDDEQGAA